jgi:hypothetical protein
MQFEYPAEKELSALSQYDPHRVPLGVKDKKILTGLKELCDWHGVRCAPYQKILEGIWNQEPEAEFLEDIPYLPVSLFKHQDLFSVPKSELRTTLTSSGTTGQQVSRIHIDTATSHRQQKSLADSLRSVLGPKRLPMLIIDTPDVFKDPKLMSARGAGVLGLMRYGFDHCFALDSDMEVNKSAIESWLLKYRDQPVFIFGFTFMVWSALRLKMGSDALPLHNAVLIHSGGWKKMIDQAVTPAEFNDEIKRRHSVKKIVNFYGMVEQIGSIFLEADEGVLIPPNFSDFIIRDPKTREPCNDGIEGLIQVVSLLPSSYPGHSLLTEDVGSAVTVVDSGTGEYLRGLRIKGRLPKSEARGCSDVLGGAS